MRKRWKLWCSLRKEDPSSTKVEKTETKAIVSHFVTGNASGRTPLHYAVLSGRKNCVEALLIVGADRFIKDGSGCNSIEISQREVADKEEREARAIAKVKHLK